MKISPVNIEERKTMDLKPGDTVRVWQKIKEGDKTRLQAFEGMVLARKHGTEAGATFTVRRVVDQIGVERIFPLYSPAIDSIEVVKRAKVRRAKLYYVREKATKELRKHLKSELLRARQEGNTDTKKKEEKKEAKVEGK
ncbi:MAG: 50S ribosomal protein L19 [Patescibacteria group bacterium]|nr:50S ribosomal protein L19 [Patescibacteria group bacterium]MDE1945690.1 50S ribosomal protein L19 [Patescibacteria group bacterium]